MVSEEIIIKLRAEVEQARRQLAKVKKDLQAQGKMFTETGRVSKQASNTIARNQQMVEKRVGNLNKALMGGKRAFAGWAMSIMFFGMLIQRVFNQIWRVATKTFQDVMHSVEGTVTPLDMLNAQFDVLKFTIGSALSEAIAPMIPTIAELVEKISAWIQDHEELFGKILIGIGILGTLLFLLGTLKLAWDGIAMGMSLAKASMFAFSTAVSSVGSIATALGLSSALVLIGLVAAAIGVLALLWTTNLGGFRDFVKNTLDSIWNFFKDTFENIKSFLGNVFGFITSIFTGEWDKALGYLLNALLDVAKMMVDAFFFVATMAQNLFVFVRNVAIDLIKAAVVGLLNLVKMAIQALGGEARGVINAINSVNSIASGLKGEYSSYEDNEFRQGANDFLSGLQTQVTNNIIINNPTESEVEDAIRQPMSLTSGGNSTFGPTYG